MLNNKLVLHDRMPIKIGQKQAELVRQGVWKVCW